MAGYYTIFLFISASTTVLDVYYISIAVAYTFIYAVYVSCACYLLNFNSKQKVSIESKCGIDDSMLIF